MYINIAGPCHHLAADFDAFMSCNCAVTFRHHVLCEIWRNLFRIEILSHLSVQRGEHYKEGSLKQVKVLYKKMK